MSQMTRRQILTFVAALPALGPIAAAAQRQFKIGLLDTGLGATFAVPFLRKLTELGYVEGQSIIIERRSADGKPERLNDLAEDLVRQRVEVIVTAGGPAGAAAKKVTQTIPIVLGAISDRSGLGWLRASRAPVAI
jgi:putative ABC transport system substrate-binding protein